MSNKFEQISVKSGFMKHNGGVLFRVISDSEYEFKTIINDLAKETGVDDIEKTVNKAKPINLTEEITNSINTAIKDNVDSDDSNKGSK